MTYNMEIVGEGEPYAEADVKLALERITAARRAQLKAHTHGARLRADTAMIQGLTALYAAHPNAFELTAGGMVDARSAMGVLGMLDPNTAPGRFPTYREFGVTDQMVRDAADEDGSECPQLAAYYAARDAVLEAQTENPIGIPPHKLKDNSGWLVTPDEITAALGGYRTAVGDGREPLERFWWPFWIAFLERAGEHGGFRVS